MLFISVSNDDEEFGNSAEIGERNFCRATEKGNSTLRKFGILVT
jgi:hypothetical protein